MVAWLKRWEDDFNENDMKQYMATTPKSPTSSKGKEPEKVG